MLEQVAEPRAFTTTRVPITGQIIMPSGFVMPQYQWRSVKQSLYYGTSRVAESVSVAAEAVGMDMSLQRL